MTVCYESHHPISRETSLKKLKKKLNIFYFSSDHVCFFMVLVLVKGAVCRILTLLKHKNTIIVLQIFKKHAKLTYLFIWKAMLQSVILLWICAVRPGMSVFVMVCETRPLPVYPIVFRHPGLPVAGKHSVFNLIHCHVRSFLLVSLIWQPAHASEEEGLVKKTLSNILNLDCNTCNMFNPTYSTFNDNNPDVMWALTHIRESWTCESVLKTFKY